MPLMYMASCFEVFLTLLHDQSKRGQDEIQAEMYAILAVRHGRRCHGKFVFVISHVKLTLKDIMREIEEF